MPVFGPPAWLSLELGVSKGLLLLFQGAQVSNTNSVKMFDCCLSGREITPSQSRSNHDRNITYSCANFLRKRGDDFVGKLWALQLPASNFVRDLLAHRSVWGHEKVCFEYRSDIAFKNDIPAGMATWREFPLFFWRFVH